MAKQNLRTLTSDSQKQRKHRAKKKQMIAELADKSPTNAAKLRKFMNESPGALENLLPGLHQAIINLVTVGAGADLPSQIRVKYLMICMPLFRRRVMFSVDKPCTFV